MNVPDTHVPIEVGVLNLVDSPAQIAIVFRPKQEAPTVSVRMAMCFFVVLWSFAFFSHVAAPVLEDRVFDLHPFNCLFWGKVGKRRHDIAEVNNTGRQYRFMSAGAKPCLLCDFLNVYLVGWGRVMLTFSKGGIRYAWGRGDSTVLEEWNTLPMGWC